MAGVRRRRPRAMMGTRTGIWAIAIVGILLFGVGANLASSSGSSPANSAPVSSFALPIATPAPVPAAPSPALAGGASSENLPLGLVPHLSYSGPTPTNIPAAWGPSAMPPGAAGTLHAHRDDQFLVPSTVGRRELVPRSPEHLRREVALGGSIGPFQRLPRTRRAGDQSLFRPSREWRQRLLECLLTGGRQPIPQSIGYLHRHLVRDEPVRPVRVQRAVLPRTPNVPRYERRGRRPGRRLVRVRRGVADPTFERFRGPVLRGPAQRAERNSPADERGRPSLREHDGLGRLADPGSVSRWSTRLSE